MRFKGQTLNENEFYVYNYIYSRELMRQKLKRKHTIDSKSKNFKIMELQQKSRPEFY